MKIAIFSAKPWVKETFTQHQPEELELQFFETPLGKETAPLARGFEGVCIFVNDQANEEILELLAEYGVKVIALRCAGFNNVDLQGATKRGIQVCRVPAYSPYAVAEYAVGMIMTLNRKYHRAYSRVREGNFSLDGLLGFDLRAKTVGVIGTGTIGQIFVQIITGFGVNVLAYDKQKNPAVEALGGRYVDLETLYRESDIISLHCPLVHETYHLINEYAIASMKEGVMIINTSRGALINSHAIIEGLKSGKVGYVGLDVYEEEADLFFENLSDQVIQDDTFVRLQTFPNVLITGHQAFFTKEAVQSIRDTTYKNLLAFLATGNCENQVLR